MSTPAAPTVQYWRFAYPTTAADHETWTLLETADNVDHTVSTANMDTGYAVIFKVENTGDMAANADYVLQYSLDGSTGWTNVTTTSSYVRVDTTSGATDEQTGTTERLTSVTETFTASAVEEGDGTLAANIGGHDAQEFYFSIHFRSADFSGGDDVYLRLTSGDTVTMNATPRAIMEVGAIEGSHTFILDNTQTEAAFKAALGEHTLTLNTSQTEASTKTMSESIAYINQLAQNQDQMISVSEALAFILQVAQQETQEIVIPLSINLNTATNFILESILTGQKSITIGNLLSQFSQQNIQTYQDTLLNINLSDNYTGVAAAIIAGEVTLGSTFAYQADVFRAITASINMNVVLDKASQVYRLFEENTNFSFTLNFGSEYLGTGIFDDPVYSAGNYIFVDLTKIALASGTIKSASITFTTSQGEQQTVGLIGQAAQTLLMQLIENQIANKVTATQNTFTINLDQTELQSLLQLAEFSTTLNLDKLSSTQIDALKTAVYLANLNQNQSVLTATNEELNLTTILDINSLYQLIGLVNVNFGITLDFLKDVKIDLSTAISFLSSLDFISAGDNAIEGVNTFNINLLQTNQVQSILNSTLLLIKNMSEASNKQAIVDKTITYLIELLDTYNTDVLATVAFIMQMQGVNTETLTADKAASIIINLAEENNVALTTAEALNLVIQLADSYSATKSLPTQLTLSTSMKQLQSKLVDKLITISFALALEHIKVSKVDFNAFSTLIAAFTSSLLGDVSGTISGFVTFASQISQDNTSISLYNKNVGLNNILSDQKIGNLEWYKSLNILLQLDQLQSWNLGLTGTVLFNTFYSKLASSVEDFRPSISFNLEALNIPQTTKDTLANALINIESDMIANQNIGIVSLINFGLQQGFETDLRLTVEGELQLTTQLSDSIAVNYLGQIGITFGHLLGLTALSRADFAESIAFGTISDFQVDEFVLNFTVTLPEGRILKIYFEDRIKIIDEEGREIKVYYDFRTDPTIN